MYSPTSEFNHVPVLMSEVLNGLDCGSNKNYLDLTMGGAGHARRILEATGPHGIYVGTDRDANAVAVSAQRLQMFGDRVKISKLTMSECGGLIRDLDFPLHGALIDCGVSSHQLDTGDRGFSFMADGRLDMRMDLSADVSAWEVVNKTREEELANLIYEFGEERYSRKVAKAIVIARQSKAIDSTLELADIVRKSIGSKYFKTKIHPATRTFQALRIFVNQELEELSKTLDILHEQLGEGARIAVITFHSLEDRIVKHRFRSFAQAGRGKLITKKPVIAQETECKENPRSRSAKLRVLEIVSQS